MRDDSVLVAIESAFRSPAFCGCGNSLTIAVHEDAAWLECRSLTQPSRLPAIVRLMLHDRRFVIEVPPVVAGPAVQPALSAAPAASLRVARERG
jgi:hypothetical protein